MPLLSNVGDWYVSYYLSYNRFMSSSNLYCFFYVFFLWFSKGENDNSFATITGESEGNSLVLFTNDEWKTVSSLFFIFDFIVNMIN